MALVGENGSGKTTLVKLLAGLYAPERGRILWDGVDAATADRQQLAERIAMVAQDFKRWPFTARVNVAVGRASVPLTDERVTSSVTEAGAEDVVADLPAAWTRCWPAVSAAGTSCRAGSGSGWASHGPRTAVVAS